LLKIFYLTLFLFFVIKLIIYFTKDSFFTYHKNVDMNFYYHKLHKAFESLLEDHSVKAGIQFPLISISHIQCLFRLTLGLEIISNSIRDDSTLSLSYVSLTSISLIFLSIFLFITEGFLYFES
jgi:hypothetical protein